MAKKTLEQKAAEAGLPYSLVKRRIKRGMDEKKALTLPYQAQKAHKKINADPERKPDPMDKVDAYTDGITLTIALAILLFVVIGMIWMIAK
jgi:hypothetical protein